jgi:hypothetical protein
VRRPFKAEKIKIMTVATLVTRNSNEAIVAPVVGPGGGCVWRESGVWSQAVKRVWQESGFSCREDPIPLNFTDHTQSLFKINAVKPVLRKAYTAMTLTKQRYYERFFKLFLSTNKNTLSEISGSHGGEYEDHCHLICRAV